MKYVKKLINILLIVSIILTVFSIPFLSEKKLGALMLGCVILFIFKSIIFKEAIYKYNKLDLFIIIMAITYGFSILFSKTPNLSIPEFVLLVITLVFGVILREVMSNEKNIKYLLHAVNFSTLIVCFYGFYQAFFDRRMENAWQDPNALDKISFRVYSTLDNPNLLAIFLVLVIPVAIFMLIYERKLIMKIYYAISLIILLICLGLTFSRTGMLGLVVAVLIFIIFINIKYILLLLIGSICAIPFLPANIIARIKSIAAGDSTVTYRYKIWETTMEMVRDNPLTGVGYGSKSYVKAYENYLGRTKIVAHAHNTFLEVLAETGIIGFLAFLLFTIQIYVKYISAILKEADRFNKLMLIMGISIVSGFTVNGLAEYAPFFYKNMIMFYVLLFLTSQYTELVKD